MWIIYKKQIKNKKFKETRDSRYIYQNELHKVCFEHDTAYEDFKDWTRRTASNKIVQRGLASMVYKFFDKKILVVVLKLKICQTKN